ncbi:MAG: diphthine--ammonia ligase [Chitinophagaceae bacterium]|jgi:uncharacterized protein (TIGR00290 family)|nr:diphthine--ammonia ligase [Chitinophagaceae bacterium]
MTGLSTFFNWSGGKDSALALYHLLQDQRYSIGTLLTSINSTHNRISMHGVRRDLLMQQAEAIGLPLRLLELPDQPDMDIYEQTLHTVTTDLQNNGYTHAAFGDIFLEDLRQYRETQLARANMQAVFPLWKRDTRELLHEFVDLGFKTIIVCTNDRFLSADFAGRIIDRDFLKDLPADVDPCGENGEFHSFVFDGPIFNKPVSFTLGEKVYRTYASPEHTDTETANMGFWYHDLLPLD